MAPGICATYQPKSSPPRLCGTSTTLREPQKAVTVSRSTCTLCSLTSFVFDGDDLAQVLYSEPVGDMIPAGDRSAPFSAGGAPEERRP